MAEIVKPNIEDQAADDEIRKNGGMNEKLENLIVAIQGWFRLPREKAKWTDIATVILAAVMAYFASVQLSEQREGGKQTDRIVKANESLAKSNERFAKAMEDSIVKNEGASKAISEQTKIALQAQIDNFHLEQRAWVGADSFSMNLEVSKPVHITVSLRNTGKTPAKRVIIHGMSEPVPKYGKPTFQYDKAAYSGILMPPNTPFDLTLFSSRNRTTGEVAGVSKAAVEAIESGLTELYVHGEVTYFDVFKKPHWMRFCARYRPEAKSFSACHEHNDTDAS